MRRFVRDLASGRGGAVWLVGEPGIGKTALLTEALSEARDAGVAVFHGAADELGRTFNLRPLATCLGVDVLSAGSTAHGDARAIGGISVLSERMLEHVRRECARGPMAIVLDDLQWADSDSVAAWRRLTQLAGRLPLLLMTARRRVPLRADVDALERAVTAQSHAALIELEALDAVDAMAMASGSLMARPGQRLEAALSAAGGHPLHLQIIIDELIRGGLIQTANGIAELEAPADACLARAAAAIGRRLSFLTDSTREVLRCAAMLGGRFSADELVMASGRPSQSLLDAVEEGLAAGLIAEDEGTLIFRLPLARQALHDEMPSAIRAGLHSHVATHLASAGASWERVARHALAAPEPVSGWMPAWLAGLPASALRTQPTLAAEVLLRAHSSAPNDPARAIIAARLTTALRALRRWDELTDAGLRALSWVEDARDVDEVATNLLAVSVSAHDIDDRLADIAHLVARKDLGGPWPGRIKAIDALVHITQGQVSRAATTASWAAAVGEQTGDPLTLALATHALSQCGPATDALALVDRALAWATPTEQVDADIRSLLMNNRLVCLSRLRRKAEFEQALRETLATTAHADPSRRCSTHLLAAIHHRRYGDWEAALPHLRATKGSTNVALRLGRHGLAAENAVRGGDRAAAEAQLALVADVAYTSGRLRNGGAFLIAARALLAESGGRTDEAMAELAGWLDPPCVSGAPDRLAWLPELIRLARAAGDHGVAAAAVSAAAEDAPLDADEHTARICSAMITRHPAVLLAAAVSLEQQMLSPAAAFAYSEAAVCLAEGGDLVGARAAVDQAARTYLDLGAILDLRRVQARLRPYGIRRGPRFAHSRVESGWKALTPTERSIAALIARGASNQEIANDLFLSRRTVESHVSHLLGKLNMRRADIVRETAVHPQIADDVAGRR